MCVCVLLRGKEEEEEGGWVGRNKYTQEHEGEGDIFLTSFSLDSKRKDFFCLDP